MPSMSTSYHCPGCGNRVEHITGRLNPHCRKCGVLLVEGELSKPGKRGLIFLLVAVATVLSILIYLAVK